MRDGPRLPAHRVPRARQRGHRGGRLRQGADGLPHAAPRTSATRRSARTVARFYREFKGRRATFARLPARRRRRSAASRSDGSSTTSSRGRARRRVGLQARPGGRRARTAPRFVVDGVLRQTQPGAPFAARRARSSSRPSAASIADHGAHRRAPSSRSRSRAESRPVGAARSTRTSTCSACLDPRETPPSIGQIFGEPSILAVLPVATPARRAWRRIASCSKGWQSDAHRITVRDSTPS
ncbi:MAG: hypothetical protein MZV64_42440 [Ignavibacteriales bacterium]|nr:hypothetical protein [Ignavibacteriales bacterium]